MLTRLCNAVAGPLVRYQIILQSVSTDFAVCRTIPRGARTHCYQTNPLSITKSRACIFGVCAARSNSEIRIAGVLLSINYETGACYHDADCGKTSTQSPVDFASGQ